MPFPILDGGMILLLLIESVLRHDISLNVKERIYQAAFVVLVVFFAFVIFNDVTKLPIFNHDHPLTGCGRFLRESRAANRPPKLCHRWWKIGSLCGKTRQ